MFSLSDVLAALARYETAVSLLAALATATFAGTAWWATHTVARVEAARFLFQRLELGLTMAFETVDRAQAHGLPDHAAAVFNQATKLSQLNARPKRVRRALKALEDALAELNRLGVEANQAIIRAAIQQQAQADPDQEPHQ